VNCTKLSPSGFVATTSSPAISGASFFERHTAWPCLTFQPGWDKSTGGSFGKI
jgi:hypothetical protein